MQFREDRQPRFINARLRLAAMIGDAKGRHVRQVAEAALPAGQATRSTPFSTAGCRSSSGNENSSENIAKLIATRIIELPRVKVAKTPSRPGKLERETREGNVRKGRSDR